MAKRKITTALARRSPARKPAARKPVPPKPARRASPPEAPLSPTHTVAARQLFWANVMREILTSLSTVSALRPADGEEQTDEQKADAAAKGTPTYDPTLFDGRLAVLTHGGERVAIAAVYPVFACGINTPGDRALSIALECTVFQINTPDGHVYTLPLHEIRAFHSLTPELMRRLERSAQRRVRGPRAPRDTTPFGFAAFTSISQNPGRPQEPASEHPME
jgi:hypothetical protein